METGSPSMADPSPARVRRRLTRRYVTALVVVALAAVAATVLILAALGQLTNDAHEVNLAGRQRMLSQRIAKGALVARAGGAPEAALDADVRQWAGVHYALRDGGAHGLSGVEDPAIRAALDSITPHVEGMRAATAALHDALEAGDGDRADRAVEAVLAAERAFLPTMDRAVFALDADSEAGIRRAQWSVLLALAVVMGTLVVVARAVLRPSVDGVARALEKVAVQGRLLRLVVDTIPDHIYVKDTEGRATLRNRASARALGFDDPTEAVGRTDAALADDLAVVRTGLPVENREEPSGTGGRLLTTKVPLRDDDGDVIGLVGVSRDVTAARSAEAKFRALVEHSVVGAAIIQDGRFAYVNPRMGEIFGYEPEEMTGLPALEIIHEDDQALVRENIRRRIEGEVDVLTYEARGRRKDGRTIHLELAGVAAEHDGRPAVIGTLNDITERHQMESALYHQAHHDELTGLPNRALFAARLEVALAEAERDGDFGVLFIDLDRFKVVNDTLGHSAGDRLLQEIADRLRRVLRPDDTVARLGGDEFAVLLSGSLPPGRAEAVAERIQAALAAPVQIDGEAITVGASIGVVAGRADHVSPDAVLGEADLAMYSVKGTGRGGHATFNADSHATAAGRLRLEMDLQHAVERGELRLVYQPVVRLADGALTGFEALVRWAHPELGLLTPDAFMGPAEQSGQVVTIDRWVLDAGTRQLGAWRAVSPADRPLTLSVNCTGRDLADPDYTADVERVAVERLSEPGQLSIEITETLLIENPEAVATELARLRARGVRFSIDDFGTGYSSLATLHALPVDTIKIDRSFVMEVGAEARSAALVRTMVELGQTLDKSVVAEGIETAAQLEVLRELGCQYGQGYLFARPLPPAEAEALIGADAPPWAVHWSPDVLTG